ncbi:MAG: VOC family protein, partial [Mycobacteriales bacterium]
PWPRSRVGTVAGMTDTTPSQPHRFAGLHHVQLAIPEGSEEQARQFYAGLLGMAELDKPPALAARGGCWFRGDRLEVHLGVEADFRPALKAHPGILVTGLDGLAERLAKGGVEVEWDDKFPGHRRFYAADPYGNRLEFLEPDGMHS